MKDTQESHSCTVVFKILVYEDTPQCLFLEVPVLGFLENMKAFLEGRSDPAYYPLSKLPSLVFDGA